MNTKGLLIFCGFAFGPGLIWLLKEVWQDRKEKKHSISAKLSLLVTWPVLGPMLAYKSGRIGRTRRIITTVSSLIIALLLADAGWIQANLISYKDAARRANALVQTTEFTEVAVELGRIPGILRNLKISPPTPGFTSMREELTKGYLVMKIQADAMEATLYLAQGKLQEAEKKALSTREFVQGYPEAGPTFRLAAMGILADIYARSGNSKQAEPLLKEIQDLAWNNFGPNSDQALLSSMNLLWFYKVYRRPKEALPQYAKIKESLEARDPNYRKDPKYRKLIAEIDAALRPAKQ